MSFILTFSIQSHAAKKMQQAIEKKASRFCTQVGFNYQIFELLVLGKIFLKTIPLDWVKPLKAGAGQQ